MVNVLSLAALALVQVNDFSTGITLTIFGIYASIVNAYFLFDLILSFTVFGYQYIIKQKKVLLIEIVLQVFSIIAEILFWFGHFKNQVAAVNLLNVICLFRVLRILDILSELY